MIVFCSIFWICHNFYIDFFKFNMDLSRLIKEIFQVATWICMDLSKSCDVFFALCQTNQAEV